MNRFLFFGVLACSFAGSVAAQDIRVPSGATLTADVSLPGVAAAVPVGPYVEPAPETRVVSGTQRTRAYRVPGAGQTSALLLGPLSDQIAESGFNVLYQCQSDVCGGFDFRFQLAVVPPPDMFVDLGDFGYLAAAHADGRVVSILTSTSGTGGYIQISQISPANVAVPDVEIQATAPNLATAAIVGDFSETLDTQGRVVLEDLQFESGSSNLGAGPFDSLAKLAAYLAAEPDRTIALVGHTDASGSLEINISISRARAAAVRDRLISEYGTTASQVDAQGMGYLAPRTTNLTENGRSQNRRVEAILTSTR